ncbi:MAG: FeoA family protein [Planctomycetaceae bacterium]|jgi:Fe2+ transport system protein FeoA
MPGTRLSDVTEPGAFRCVRVECEGDAMIRLKRLGICARRGIEVIQPGDPMVLRVVGSRLGVSRQLAEFVTVETMQDPAKPIRAAEVKHA